MKKYILYFSDGERLTATGEMCDFIRIGFYEAAVRLNEQGEKKLADEFLKKSNEIYSQLNIYKRFEKELII